MRRSKTPSEQRWYPRDEVVRVGSELGIVLAADLDGVHFVYLTRERRVVAVAGIRLNALAPQMAAATIRNAFQTAASPAA